MTHPPSVSVVVPTHHRPDHLARCLDALASQTVRPLEVVVVRGLDDHAAATVLAGRGAPVVELVLPTSTLVHRLHAGAARTTSEVIAYTDDDAEPRRDWVERIQAHLTDPSIGAVGGRDVQPGDDRADATDVGRIRWGGRLVGEHSHGTGAARDVDHLRGVNMAFRRDVLRLPVGLRGSGAPDYNELAPCLAVRDAGRRVVYDPMLLVDHHVAPRDDYGHADRRDPTVAKRLDDVFNQSYTLLSMRPSRRFERMAYVVLVGDRSTGGLLRCAVAALQGDRHLAGELRPLWRAHLEAWRESRRNPLRTVGADEPWPQ